MKKSTKKPQVNEYYRMQDDLRAPNNPKTKIKKKNIKMTKVVKKIKSGAKDFKKGVIAGIKNPITAPIKVIKKIIKKKKDKKRADIRDSAKRKG